LETVNEHQEYIAHLKELLVGENLSEIDFDRVAGWMDQLDCLLSEMGNRQAESDVLRGDLIDRLSGIVKAIVAVGDGRTELSGSLQYLESLKTMSAEELIEQYRRVSARFRDAFPTSFGLPVKLGRSSGVNTNPAEFK